MELNSKANPVLQNLLTALSCR